MAYKPDYPNIYQGKQAIINSDRILFNAKEDSILLFSKESISLSAGGSIHFDTSEDETSKFVINSPLIYLGLEDEDKKPLAKEPVVLGYQLERLLGDLADAMNDLCFSLKYTYLPLTTMPGAPTAPNPANEALMANIETQIDMFKQNLHLMMSERVKVVSDYMDSSPNTI